MSRILRLFAAALFAVPMVAQAQQSVDIDFTGSYTNGNGIAGNVLLTGTSVGVGEYLITSVSGTINGESVSLLPETPCVGPTCGSGLINGFPLYGSFYSSGPNAQGWAYDDIYYTGAAATANDGALDEGGIGLSIAGDAINICQCAGPGSFSYGDEITWPPGAGYNAPNVYVPIALVSKTVPTPVPEPASLTLFGLGMAGLALARRRRKN